MLAKHPNLLWMFAGPNSQSVSSTYADDYDLIVKKKTFIRHPSKNWDYCEKRATRPYHTDTVHIRTWHPHLITHQIDCYKWKKVKPHFYQENLLPQKKKQQNRVRKHSNWLKKQNVEGKISHSRSFHSAQTNFKHHKCLAKQTTIITWKSEIGRHSL